jgi:putative DNA primase/helicase
VGGKDGEYIPKPFSSFCPKIICGIDIARLTHTTLSRTIRIPLQKNLPDEEVEPFNQYVKTALGKRCDQWAKENKDRLKSIAKDPRKVTQGFAGREADIAAPLLAMTSLCGDRWDGMLRDALPQALRQLGGQEPGYSQMILEDIRKIFDEKKVDRITSADLVEALVDMEDRVWREVKKGKPLDQRGLNGFLKGFGVSSDNVRFPEVRKGFHKEWFEDAWKRYVPRQNASQKDLSA